MAIPTRRGLTREQEFGNILIPQNVMLVEAQFAVFHSYLRGVELGQKEQIQVSPHVNTSNDNKKKI